MKQRSGGFTLIEIVLVLAIAGLIIVIVFSALSGAKRSREDSQRRSDLVQYAGLIESYASNNEGKYPTVLQVDDQNSDFRKKYGTEKLIDPLATDHYIVQSDFDPCLSGEDYQHHGPGYISYVTPGYGSHPYTMRICLSAGEFYVNK